MQLNFTLGVVINGIAIVLGIFAAFSLSTRQHNRLANRLMAVFLATTSLWLLDNFLRIGGIYDQNPDYYFLPIYYSFAFGPLLYFYVRAIINSDFRFQRKHLIHFIPVFVQACLYLFLTFQDYEFKRWYWTEVHFPFTYRIEFDGSFISMAIYLFFSLRLLREYRSWLSEKYSDISKNHLNWLRFLFIMMLVLVLQWFAEVILRDIYENYLSYNYTPFVLGLLTLIMAHKAFHQNDQKEIVFQPEKDQKTSATERLEFDSSTLRQIEERMQIHQDYLEPSLSLKTFAARCKLPQKTVSLYLNRQLQKSFHDYVNGYRIEAFKNKSVSLEEQNLTLEGLAYECGFNSKATFNRIFKKTTGMTPGQYVSKHRKA